MTSESRRINLSIGAHHPKKENLFNRLQKELKKTRSNYDISLVSRYYRTRMGPKKWRNKTYAVEKGSEAEFIRLQIEELFLHIKELNKSNEERVKNLYIQLNREIILLMLEIFNFFTFFKKKSATSVIDKMIELGILTITDPNREILKYHLIRQFMVKLLNAETLNPESELIFSIRSTYRTKCTTSLMNSNNIFEESFSLSESEKLKITLSNYLIEPGEYKLVFSGFYQIPTIQEVGNERKMITESDPFDKHVEKLIIHPKKVNYQISPVYILTRTQGCLTTPLENLDIVLLDKVVGEEFQVQLNNITKKITLKSDDENTLDLNEFKLGLKTYPLSLTYLHTPTNLYSCESVQNLITFSLVAEKGKKIGDHNLYIQFSDKTTIKVRLQRTRDHKLIFSDQIIHKSYLTIPKLKVYESYLLDLIDPISNSSSIYTIRFPPPELPEPSKIKTTFKRIIDHLVNLNQFK
ncbi:MAG: hypothetical protein ACTSRC_19980 [Candidatus Helarchaeota archaeon]